MSTRRDRAQRRRERRAEDAVRLARRRRAWKFRCQGWQQERIAVELGVSQPTISRDLLWASNQALANLSSLVEQTKIEQVGVLGYIIEESLDAWRKSQEPDRTVSRRQQDVASAAQAGAAQDGSVRTGAEEDEAETVASQASPPVVTTTRVRGQVGNRGFLETAMNALAAQRKILGAEAPLHIIGDALTENVIIVLPDNLRGDRYDGGEDVP